MFTRRLQDYWTTIQKARMWGFCPDWNKSRNWSLEIPKYLKIEVPLSHEINDIDLCTVRNRMDCAVSMSRLIHWTYVEFILFLCWCHGYPETSNFGNVRQRSRIDGQEGVLQYITQNDLKNYLNFVFLKSIWSSKLVCKNITCTSWCFNSVWTFIRDIITELGDVEPSSTTVSLFKMFINVKMYAVLTSYIFNQQCFWVWALSRWGADHAEKMLQASNVIVWERSKSEEAKYLSVQLVSWYFGYYLLSPNHNRCTGQIKLLDHAWWNSLPKFIMTSWLETCRWDTRQSTQRNATIISGFNECGTAMEMYVSL